MNFKVEKYDEVSSTNDLIKERIDEGENEGLVVVAKRQTAGYGRRGNTWSSPDGGLYMSILLRPLVGVENLPTLPHACAIAVRRAIVSFMAPSTADAVKIKWPNDIVYMNGDDRIFNKLCGISVEQRGGAICLGIGVNVVRSESPVLYESKNRPAYVSELANFQGSLSIDFLGEKILEELDSVYRVWSDSLLRELRLEYMDHFALKGFKARIEDGCEHAVKCEVVGMNEQGNLEVIPFGETEVKTIVSGSVRSI